MNEDYIKKIMFEELQKGIKDKQILYSLFVETLRLPRPTIRKIASSLRHDLKNYIAILEQGVIKNWNTKSMEIYPL